MYESSTLSVIVAGGGGTRLWPLSRVEFPKQFAKIKADCSLLQAAILRVQQCMDGRSQHELMVICNEDYRFLTQQELHACGNQARIILEPEGRNTAPALTVAALLTLWNNYDPIIIMTPSDHRITDDSSFCKTLKIAIELATKRLIVTLGVRPEGPETGFGYIHRGERLVEINAAAFAIRRFREKPDLETAQRYLTTGEYFWNSGIFVIRASLWLEAIGELQPKILECCREAVNKGSMDGDFFSLDRNEFLSCPAESVDCAVMEHLHRLNGMKGAVVPLECGWSDIGNWSAVWAALGPDVDGNATHGDAMLRDSKNCLVLTDNRLVVALGCQNLAIVETADAVLVLNRDYVQEVRLLVDMLKQNRRVEWLSHRRVYRPWGSYESVHRGEKIQVKRIMINPGKKLSLQLHHHRAEHWVVVKGTATITRGNEILKLQANESTFIPHDTKHRIENEGDYQLEIIEVQWGDYLGEDDIIRFEDDYGRVTNQCNK